MDQIAADPCDWVDFTKSEKEKRETQAEEVLTHGEVYNQAFNEKDVLCVNVVYEFSLKLFIMITIRMNSVMHSDTGTHNFYSDNMVDFPATLIRISLAS